MRAIALVPINKSPQAINELREAIGFVEAKIKEFPQLEVPVTHHFSKGVYAREMFLQKGAVVTGAIHRFANLNILSQGEVSFISIDGEVRAKAPYSWVASPGTKRVIYAHEDTVWTTIHGTDETDLAKIEEIFISKDYGGLE